MPFQRAVRLGRTRRGCRVTACYRCRTLALVNVRLHGRVQGFTLNSINPKDLAMRSLLLLAAASLFSCSFCYGADEPASTAAKSLEGAEPSAYIVEFTEFQLKGPPNTKLNAHDLVRVLEEEKTSDNVKFVETVRLSVLTNHESLVQFGKAVTVTVGAVLSASGRARNTQTRQVGTIARVTASHQNGHVLLKLMYEAARHNGQGTDDSPPDVTTSKFETTLLLKPGIPALVGGTSAEPSSYLLVTLSQQPQ